MFPCSPVSCPAGVKSRIRGKAIVRGPVKDHNEFCGNALGTALGSVKGYMRMWALMKSDYLRSEVSWQHLACAVTYAPLPHAKRLQNAVDIPGIKSVMALKH